jgi:hypothetical protein
MGANNAQGIYVYDETDKASPVSTLLNKLGSSITQVVTGIRSRVTALENAQPVVVVAGRYSIALNNVPPSAPTPVGTPTYVSAGSSTQAPTFWVRRANGWTFNKRGSYLLTIACTTTALINRTFIDVTVGNESYRIALTATNEDSYAATLAFVVPADGTFVSLSVFHSATANRNYAIRADIFRIGALT